MRRRCLGGCGRLILGTYCDDCKLGTGWGKGRDRSAQARFARAVKERDGHRCTWMQHGARCTATTDLRACHITALAEGGSYDLSNGITRCGQHDRMTDPHAR